MSQGKIYPSSGIQRQQKTPKPTKPETIAIVCPLGDVTSATISDPFLLSLIGQLGDVLARRGCELVISTFPPGKHNWKKHFFDSGKVQGLVVFGQGDFPESIDQLASENCPFVVWGSTHVASRFCTVGSDNEKGGYIATRHLLESGRRRIAFLGDSDMPEINERFLGYCRALSEWDITLDPRLTVKARSHAYSTFDALNNKLVEHNVNFDAIFATSDRIGVEAIHVLRKLGLTIPGDVSVVGFDDVHVALGASPPLSSVSQDVNFAAREIISRLFGLINSEPTKSLRLPVKLSVRASSASKAESHGTITLNHSGIIEFVDNVAERILGYELRELLGKDIYFLLPDPALLEGDMGDEFRLNDFQHKENQGVLRSILVEHKNGKMLSLDAMVSSSLVAGLHRYTCVIRLASEDGSSPFKGKDYTKVVEEAVAQRTQQLTETAERMEQLAFEDTLTNLANRRQFDDTLKFEIINASANQKYLSLIMFDVDHFKAYNDNYGHIAGDNCLKLVADVLRDSFHRASDTVARYGGEEFAAVLPLTGAKEALALAEQALANVRNKAMLHEYSSVAEHVTLSCGVYCAVPEANSDPSDLVWMADKALYESKGQGRNRATLQTKNIGS